MTQAAGGGARFRRADACIGARGSEGRPRAPLHWVDPGMSDDGVHGEAAEMKRHMAGV